MTRLFSLIIFVTIVLVALLSLRPSGDHDPDSIRNLPWQIDRLPNGRSRVFGVTLGDSTLGEARNQLGEGMTLAVIVSPGQDTGGLEMYYSHFRAGLFSGKLVLAARVSPERLEQFMKRAARAGYMDSGARKFTLNPDDLPLALGAPLESITFIPTVHIDKDSAARRFGPAEDTLRVREQSTHLLYPDKGLDLIINENGRDILQYVAPRDFERLIRKALTVQPNKASEEKPSLSSISRRRLSASI